MSGVGFWIFQPRTYHSNFMMQEPQTEEMDDAFYSSPEEEASKESPDTEETPDSIDEEERENPIALIPLSALGKDVKVGDTVTIEVKKLHDDEAEVSISSAKKMPMKETMMSADDELDSMEEGKSYGRM